MKGKKVLIGLVILAVFLITVSCKEGTTSINPSPTDVVTITKIKSEKDVQMLYVKLPHNTHEEAGVECQTCHHKKGNPARDKICADCHFGDAGDKLIHSFCIDCHSNSNEGPTKCDECHKYGKTIELQELH